MGDCYELTSDGYVSYWDREAASRASILEFGRSSNACNAHSFSLWFPNITEVRVNEANQMLSEKDGILYSKDFSKLIWYPPNRPAESFSVPNGVKSISKYAICGRSLKRIDGGRDLTEIDSNFCDNYCRINLEEICIDSDAFTSDRGVLFNKTKSTLVSCPPNCFCDFDCEFLTLIGDNALTMNRYISHVVLGDNITSIGINAFVASNIISLTGGFGLKSIKMGAFANCSKLEMVVFQEGLEAIDVGAFNNCRILKELLLPKTVTSIGFDRSYSTISKKTTILCEKGSYVEQYAKMHGHTISII